MFYWNQDYFEGLEEIGNAYSQRVGFELFGQYCLKKTAGLKKEANRLSQAFVANTVKKATIEQREITVHLCELNYSHPKVHSLINHHIAEFIQNTLFQWSESEPSSIVSHRWEALYGRYDRLIVALESALTIDPDDQIALVRKCNSIIHDLEFMTHHLNQGVLLGEVTEANYLLRELRPFASRVSNSEQKERINREMSYFTKLFELWSIYNAQSIEQNFVEWAKDTADFEW